MIKRVNCKKAFKGYIVDVRSYVIDKVKKNKGQLLITCDELVGAMLLNYDEIDNKVQSISKEIQSKIYRDNKFRLYSFIFENNYEKV